MSLDISLFLPFDEAIAWAKSKEVILPDDYYGNRIGIARAQAFSVAGLASLDQLDAVKQSLDNALAQGTSFFDWQKQIKDGVIPLDLPNHRLDNIFRTNTQSAYMAGRWQQLTDSSDDNEPTYLMYDAVNDSRTRPAHKAMDNVIKPMDDPFWKSNYPPNGFRCRCTVRRLSKKQAERMSGITPDNKIPDHAKADKGWDYNVGLSRFDGIKLALEQKLERCKRLGFSANSGNCNDLAAQLLHKISVKIATISGMNSKKEPEKALVTQNDWKHYKLADTRAVSVDIMSESPGLVHKAQTRTEALSVFMSAIGFVKSSLEVVSPIETVIFEQSKMTHFVEKEDAKRERYANYILPTIMNPFEVWQSIYSDGSTRNIYIGLFKEGEHFIVTTWVDESGSIFWNAMPVDRKKNYLNNQRKGILMFK